MTVVATPSSPTDAKRKRADSRPSRATPMKATDARASPPPAMRPEDTWGRRGQPGVRPCLRIQKTIQVTTQAASSMAVPSYSASALPSSSPTAANRIAPITMLDTSAAVTPIQTARVCSRWPVLLRTPRMRPISRVASKPSRRTMTKAPISLGDPNRFSPDPLPPGSEIYYRRMDQVVQVIGALMILTAYAAAQTGRWSTDTPLYLWLNLVGSVILAVLAATSRNWGFLLLEGVWAIVTAASLLKRRRAPA